MNRAVFLDRDGVINEMVYYEEHGFVDSPFTPDQVRVFPWVGEAVNRLRSGGYQTIMATNQPGMAKGQYGRRTFDAITARVRDDLAAQGTRLDAEYYCLHHPNAVVPEFKMVCDCRKPAPGLLLRAAAERDIDLRRSWMIGDGIKDIQAGKNAGCRTIFIGSLKSKLCQMMDEQDAAPDLVKQNLLEAALAILGMEA